MWWSRAPSGNEELLNLTSWDARAWGTLASVQANESLGPADAFHGADLAMEKCGQRRCALQVHLNEDVVPAGRDRDSLGFCQSCQLGRDLLDLRWIHLHKTGALFSASSELGALHAGAATEQRAAMAAYGEALGLAFQIVDDVLDRTGSDESLGKTPGKDLQSGKSTYPALFGLDESRRQARLLSERAQDTLRPTGLGTETLEALAEFAVTRVR